MHQLSLAPQPCMTAASEPWFAPLCAHLRLSVLILCVFASRDLAGGFRRSGRLQMLLRCSYGSSEREARTVVLSSSTGQENVVVLYIFVRLCLLDPRRARPACASPRRPCARQSFASRFAHACTLTKGPETGGKGVQDGCGEGHKALSGQAFTAGRGVEDLGVLVHMSLGAHCCPSESPTRDSSAASAGHGDRASPRGLARSPCTVTLKP